MNQTIFKLLPIKYKKLALIFIFSSIGILISSKFIDYSTTAKPVIKHLAQSVLLSGLFILIVTRSKEEDELSLINRLKAFSFSFLSIIAFSIIYPFANLIFDEKLEYVNSFQLLLTMFIAYFIILKSIKKKLE